MNIPVFKLATWLLAKIESGVVLDPSEVHKLCLAVIHDDPPKPAGHATFERWRERVYALVLVTRGRAPVDWLHQNHTAQNLLGEHYALGHHEGYAAWHAGYYWSTLPAGVRDRTVPAPHNPAPEGITGHHDLYCPLCASSYRPEAGLHHGHGLCVPGRPPQADSVRDPDGPDEDGADAPYIITCSFCEQQYDCKDPDQNAYHPKECTPSVPSTIEKDKREVPE